MKHIIILTSFMLLVVLSFSSYAQSRLLKLTDTRTGRAELVKPGAMVTYQLANDSITRSGKLGELNASAIRIDGNDIRLSEVSILGACSKGRLIAGDVAEGIGHGLTIVGQVVTWAGMEIFVWGEGYGWVIGGTVTVAGGILWGTGILVKAVLSPVLHTLKDSELSDNLKAEVVLQDKDLVYPDDIYD